MELRTLKCPNCGGSLEIEDGIDTFFCKFCGQKILLEGQSKELINAKVKIKEFQHQENIQQSKADLTKYKIDAKSAESERNDKLRFVVVIGMFIVVIIITLYLVFS